MILIVDIFFDQGFANVGNEPGLLQAVLYHYAVFLRFEEY